MAKKVVTRRAKPSETAGKKKSARSAKEAKDSESDKSGAEEEAAPPVSKQKKAASKKKTDVKRAARTPRGKKEEKDQVSSDTSSEADSEESRTGRKGRKKEEKHPEEKRWMVKNYRYDGERFLELLRKPKDHPSFVSFVQHGHANLHLCPPFHHRYQTIVTSHGSNRGYGYLSTFFADKEATIVPDAAYDVLVEMAALYMVSKDNHSAAALGTYLCIGYMRNEERARGATEAALDPMNSTSVVTDYINIRPTTWWPTLRNVPPQEILTGLSLRHGMRVLDTWDGLGTMGPQSVTPSLSDIRTQVGSPGSYHPSGAPSEVGSRYHSPHTTNTHPI
jgi:hypothetical protein